MSSSPGAISVEDRIGALEESANKFKDHLIDVPGVALSARLRLAVARCAQDGLKCKACIDSLPKDVCLKPGTRMFERISSIQHSCPALDVENDKAEKFILTTVHSVVNHQGRLDKQWYDDCISAIQEARIVPDSVEGQEKRLYLAYSAFAEIMLITTMAHCIAFTFLIMGSPIPRLPSSEELKQGKANQEGPKLLDWTSMLKKAPQRHLSTCHAYYFSLSDLIKTSPEYKRISESGRKAMAVYGDPYHPILCAIFAPEDARMLHEMEQVYYMPAKVCTRTHDTCSLPRCQCTT